jgi:hypothetical protein
VPDTGIFLGSCFAAYEQPDHPIYSARYVRVKFGCPKSPLRLEDLVSEDNEGQLTADDNYMWSYTSSEFPMLQVSSIYFVLFALIVYPLERKFVNSGNVPMS